MIKKISIIAAVVLVLAVVGCSIYWFSMPKEARNMMKFVMFSSGDYDNYEYYQVIERNETPLQPAGPEKTAAVSAPGDNNVNWKW